MTGPSWDRDVAEHVLGGRLPGRAGQGDDDRVRGAQEMVGQRAEGDGDVGYHDGRAVYGPGGQDAGGARSERLAAKSCSSARVPRRAANIPPGVTCRESHVAGPVICADAAGTPWRVPPVIAAISPRLSGIMIGVLP